MDRVLLGESLPRTLSIPDKRVPSFDSSDPSIGLANFVKGPVVLLTEGVQNLRLDGLLALIAITPGNLEGLMNLTRYPKQMRENVKKLDMKRSTDSWTKVRDLRHTLIQYFLQQNPLKQEKPKRFKENAPDD